MPVRSVPPALLLTLIVRAAFAAVYALEPSPGFVDIVGNPVPYGYSGTITTDGSLGDFNSAAPIVVWNITFATPGASDGVTTQVMTPATSSLAYLYGPSSVLTITPQSITITPSTDDSAAGGLEFTIVPNDEVLIFQSARPTLQKGAGAFDVSEAAFAGFAFQGFGDFVVATLAPLVGDADGDGDVDGDDLIAVQTNFGSITPPPGDADMDGDVDGDDLIAVQTNFGNPPSNAAPEPTAAALLTLACFAHAGRRR